LILELLIVEDNKQHLEDAKRYFEHPCRKAVISIHYASTLNHAEQLMSERKYDGIITDVFFPMNIAGEEERKLEILELIDPEHEFRHSSSAHEINRWMSGERNPPSGVIVAKQALESGVPVVLCTDIYHHDAAMSPVTSWVRKAKQRIEIVDIDSQNLDRKKDWQLAYAKTVGVIEGYCVMKYCLTVVGREEVARNCKWSVSDIQKHNQLWSDFVQKYHI
jgi:hypothetical protein